MGINTNAIKWTTLLASLVIAITLCAGFAQNNEPSSYTLLLFPVTNQKESLRHEVTTSNAQIRLNTVISKRILESGGNHYALRWDDYESCILANEAGPEAISIVKDYVKNKNALVYLGELLDIIGGDEAISIIHKEYANGHIELEGCYYDAIASRANNEDVQSLKIYLLDKSKGWAIRATAALTLGKAKNMAAIPIYEQLYKENPDYILGVISKTALDYIKGNVSKINISALEKNSDGDIVSVIINYGIPGIVNIMDNNGYIEGKWTSKDNELTFQVAHGYLKAYHTLTFNINISSDGKRAFVIVTVTGGFGNFAQYYYRIDRNINKEWNIKFIRVHGLN
jgi:hypothetical protein